MSIGDNLRRMFGMTPTVEASPWTNQPHRMAELARDNRFMTAMQANRRPSDLMMLPIDWVESRMPERALVQVKHDGIHVGFHRETLPVPFSREGVPFAGAAHCANELRAIDAQLGGDHYLFGEYVHIDGLTGAQADFARKNAGGTGTIMLFDAVPRAAWEGRIVSAPAIDRVAALKMAVESLGDRMHVGFCQTSLFVGANRDNIDVVAGNVWELGMEGIVVKDADSPYVRGKSPYWMRIKRRETVDLPIVATTLANGQLRSITVALPDGGTLVVAVGFKATVRAQPDRFQPGMIAELSHLGATKHGSYRSASFLRLRTDKSS